jgi:hypothetical protein
MEVFSIKWQDKKGPWTAQHGEFKLNIGKLTFNADDFHLIFSQGEVI